MRPDMHKVIVERPRWNPGPRKNGRGANVPDELLPKFEGIKRPHRHRKGQTDLLGPLKRWLRAQVSRPWNDIYSEACAVIKPDSVMRAHVKTHLLELVERHTFMHDGKVCVLDIGYPGRGIVPIEERRYVWTMFFVHPETDLLQVIPQISRRVWRTREPQTPVTVRWLKKNIALQKIRGLWFECHFEVVPVDVSFTKVRPWYYPPAKSRRSYDEALEHIVSSGALNRHDARNFLCTLKRQLSKRELRRFGLRNAPIPHSV